MPTPHQAPEKMLPDAKSAEKAGEADHGIAEAKRDLAERAEQLVDRMTKVYRARLDNGFVTKEALQDFSVNSANPEWKRVAARRASELNQ